MTATSQGAAPIARIVLLHGLASSPKEFGFLVHPLRRQGIRLVAPEIPGYSTGQLAARPRAEDWVAAAAQVVARLAEAEPGPFVLGGLCAGSALAAAVAASGRPLPGLAGLALLSPSAACDGWGLPWWYRLRHVAYALRISEHFHMSERPPYGLKNERMRELVRRQLEAEGDSSVGPARVPLSCVRESERLSRRLGPNLLRVELPLHMQHAREDEVCRLASVQRLLARLPAARCRLQVLEDSYHMITADNDRHRVAANLVEFLHAVPGMGAVRAPAPPHAPSSNTPRQAVASLPA